MLSKLYLIRHGDPLPPHGCYLGSTNIPLSETGRQKARVLAKLLPDDLRQGLILCSPLSRCKETADILFERHGKFELNDQLREVDFGQWEGMTFEKIAEAYPEAIAAWSAFQPEFTFPGGDNLAAFCSRIDLLSRTLRHCPEQVITLVTHAGVIRHLICSMLNLPHTAALLFKADYLSVSRIDVFDAGGMLGLLNRTASRGET